MVVVLTLLTFGVCILADWLMHRREVKEAPAEKTVLPVSARRPLSDPIHAGGFRVHPEMAFHPGHAWALAEAPDRVRVGIDDFARRLVGKIAGFRLPAVGDRVVQGRQAWELQKQDRQVPLLSPVTGRVVEVNPQVQGRPEVVRDDPYGEGWLLVIQATDLRINLNNLLSGDLVRRWMEDISARFRAQMGGGMVLSFPDGGTAVDDLSAVVDPAEWDRMVREFLLTEPERL